MRRDRREIVQPNAQAVMESTEEEEEKNENTSTIALWAGAGLAACVDIRHSKGAERERMPGPCKPASRGVMILSRCPSFPSMHALLPPASPSDICLDQGHASLTLPSTVTAAVHAHFHLQAPGEGTGQRLSSGVQVKFGIINHVEYRDIRCTGPVCTVLNVG
jgi:hypothetical protein